MCSQSKSECHDYHEKTSFKWRVEKRWSLECVRGYHDYQRVREAVVGENLECEGNKELKDRNPGVAVRQKKLFVGLNLGEFNFRGFLRPRYLQPRKFPAIRYVKNGNTAIPKYSVYDRRQ